MKKILDLQQIQSLIPHRPPFLFIDKIEIVETGVKGIGYKNVTINEPFFQGHFPDNPIFPGVLIIESMGQIAGCVVIDAFEEVAEVSHVYFMSADNVKFRKPVLPGDTLAVTTTKSRARGNVWKFNCIAQTVGCDDIVAEADVTAMIVKKNDNE
ncbi:MAG: 3-hydroxyacyl-ACP dehydratase FabZ [Pseudomonadota bacterium]